MQQEILWEVAKDVNYDAIALYQSVYVTVENV